MENKTRKQAAHVLKENTDERKMKRLTFWLDKQLFGISIADVVQIVGIQPITPLPSVPVSRRHR